MIFFWYSTDYINWFSFQSEVFAVAFALLAAGAVILTLNVLLLVTKSIFNSFPASFSLFYSRTCFYCHVCFYPLENGVDTYLKLCCAAFFIAFLFIVRTSEYEGTLGGNFERFKITFLIFRIILKDAFNHSKCIYVWLVYF